MTSAVGGGTISMNEYTVKSQYIFKRCFAFSKPLLCISGQESKGKSGIC